MGWRSRKNWDADQKGTAKPVSRRLTVRIEGSAGRVVPR